MKICLPVIFSIVFETSDYVSSIISGLALLLSLVSIIIAFKNARFTREAKEVESRNEFLTEFIHAKTEMIVLERSFSSRKAKILATGNDKLIAAVNDIPNMRKTLEDTYEEIKVKEKRRDGRLATYDIPRIRDLRAMIVNQRKLIEEKFP